LKNYKIINSILFFPFFLSVLYTWALSLIPICPSLYLSQLLYLFNLFRGKYNHEEILPCLFFSKRTASCLLFTTACSITILNEMIIA